MRYFETDKDHPNSCHQNTLASERTHQLSLKSTDSLRTSPLTGGRRRTLLIVEDEQGSTSGVQAEASSEVKHMAAKMDIKSLGIGRGRRGWGGQAGRSSGQWPFVSPSPEGLSFRFVHTAQKRDGYVSHGSRQPQPKRGKRVERMMMVGRGNKRNRREMARDRDGVISLVRLFGRRYASTS